MHNEIVIKNDNRYRIEIHHQLTPEFRYRGTVTVSLDGQLITEFTCLMIRPVRWDISWDCWDTLRSLGYKRIESKVWDI